MKTEIIIRICTALAFFSAGALYGFVTVWMK